MTNDDMRDEVPAPHFEDELWPTLARAHADQRWVSPSPSPTFDVASRRRGRRLVLAGVGTIAAGAALLAAVVVTGADDDGSETTTNPTTSDPADDAQTVEMALAAKITAATEEAAASSIVHMAQDQLAPGPGDAETWVDEQSGALRSLAFDSAGAPAYDSGPAVAPGADDVGPEVPDEPTAEMNPTSPEWPRTLFRRVDHCFAEYDEVEQPSLPARNEGELVGQRLAAGELVENGTELVDGRELIRLVEVPVSQLPPDPSSESTVPASPTTTVPATQPGPTSTVPATQPSSTSTVPSGPVAADELDDGLVEHVYLVDPDTYRPVRIVGYPGSDVEYLMTIEYLPRTPENLALLSPPIPDGFVQADLRGDGARHDRCGD